MLNIIIDLMYVFAGISAVLSYKNDGIDQLAWVATSYAFIAILVQFFVHLFDSLTNKIESKKKYLFTFNIGIVILSMILALSITQFLIPIPVPVK